MNDMTRQVYSLDKPITSNHGGWNAPFRDHNCYFYQVIGDGPGFILPDANQTGGTHLDSGLTNIRLECLKMANLHATPQQIADGQVYKIADDYYNYIINGKK
jgi:hypothetical protein